MTLVTELDDGSNLNITIFNECSAKHLRLLTLFASQSTSSPFVGFVNAPGQFGAVPAFEER